MAKRTFSWINPKLEVRPTPKYGKGAKGVFAKKDIQKDELLVIFGGYVFHLSDYYKIPHRVMHYLSQINDDFVFGIRSIEQLEDSCFVNHSCNPNSGYKGQIFLVAMRKIKKDEEITFDHAMELSSSKVSNPKNVIRFDKMNCKCGAKNCRRIVGDNDWKIPELQKKYDGYFQYFLQEKINRLKSRRGNRGK